jgi:hypothetical protein
MRWGVFPLGRSQVRPDPGCSLLQSVAFGSETAAERRWEKCNFYFIRIIAAVKYLRSEKMGGLIRMDHREGGLLNRDGLNGDRGFATLPGFYKIA